jgi:Domain of unknown function (DUF4118)
VALALQHYQFRDVELPVLTVAIALTTWYAGGGPSVLAVLLSSASFDYFFTEPALNRFRGLASVQFTDFASAEPTPTSRTRPQRADLDLKPPVTLSF